MSYTLTVHDLSCVRGGVCLYENISRTAQGGRCWTVVGPNGAGKTTLLRHIAGLTPGTGTVSWTPHDKTVAANPAPLFLAGSPMVKESFTVREMLTFYAAFGDKNTYCVTEIARLWHVSFLLDMPISDLSAGQKQRVSLARLGLDVRPVWLLDEPYAHLDSRGIDILNGVIDRHLKTGGFLMMASHIKPPNERVWVDFRQESPAL